MNFLFGLFLFFFPLSELHLQVVPGRGSNEIEEGVKKGTLEVSSEDQQWKKPRAMDQPYQATTKTYIERVIRSRTKKLNMYNIGDCSI